eukprot:GHRR01035900.1.p1 GENE.GHRR01035900.1~~GHRR01035900.1.p1  ORF type:complete len:126 (+),score=34.27 GHRR01035900.1:507-884(+)
MSEPARDFITSVLHKNPDKRPSILQMLQHPWIRSYQRSSSTSRAERGSSHESGEANGRVQLQPSGAPAAQVSEAGQQLGQQQQYAPALPQLGMSRTASIAAAIDILGGNIVRDDIMLTGYAVSDA